MARLDKQKQSELEPKRIQFAKSKLEELKIEITKQTSVEIQFLFKGNTISFFPYSGWYSGKGIKSGRGINNLLKQL